jgi:predicted nucleotidyltransferase
LVVSDRAAGVAFRQGARGIGKMSQESFDMNERIIHFFKAQEKVIAVYLFGSYARGRAGDRSDIDLAILMDPDAEVDEFELKRDVMIGLSKVLRKEVHLVILNTAGEVLSAQVFKHGKCLYNSKPAVLSEFRMVEFSKIADFGYLRNIMEKGFTRKIMAGKR